MMQSKEKHKIKLGEIDILNEGYQKEILKELWPPDYHEWIILHLHQFNHPMETEGSRNIRFEPNFRGINGEVEIIYGENNDKFIVICLKGLGVNMARHKGLKYERNKERTYNGEYRNGVRVKR